MAKGYQTDEIKQKLVDVLKESKTGMSGVEISESLGVNRITMTKYLKIFATEGLIGQKKFGSTTLWFTKEGVEQYRFPDDYFKAKKRFIDTLTAMSEDQAYNLIRNCLYSEAKIPKIINEIIIPAIEHIQDLFSKGKIGNSEEKLLNNYILNSIKILNLESIEFNPKKNVILLAADAKSSLLSEAAAASFHSENWKVFSIGDMSSSIDVLFDLDLQKFLGRVWKQKKGIMIVVVFSDSEEGLKFFANAVNSIKEKIRKNLFLVLCGKMSKKIKCDLISENLDPILQWSQTSFESSES